MGWGVKVTCGTFYFIDMKKSTDFAQSLSVIYDDQEEVYLLGVNSLSELGYNETLFARCRL